MSSVAASAGKSIRPRPRGNLTPQLLLGALAVVLVAAPLLFYPVFLMKIMCMALLGLSFNMLLGYAGLTSFGHAAFFGGAAYVAGYSAKVWGTSPELSLLMGGLAAAALGLLFGLVAIRRQGIHFAMITLALSQTIYFFCAQAGGLTGGENGMQAIPRGRVLGIFGLEDTLSLYAAAASAFFLVFLAAFRILHSPFGHVLLSIRDNESRAISLGYRVNRYKLLALVLSAAIAGVAGALQAIVLQIVTLGDVHWAMSGEAILIALLGGLGTLTGPIVGAVVLVTVQDYFAFLGSWFQVAQGLIFIFCVLLFRDGLVGWVARKFKLAL